MEKYRLIDFDELDGIDGYIIYEYEVTDDHFLAGDILIIDKLHKVSNSKALVKGANGCYCTQDISKAFLLGFIVGYYREGKLQRV